MYDNLTTKEKIYLNFASLGPIGRTPVAQGTWGSLAAIVVAPLIFMPLPWYGRLVALILVLYYGSIAATLAEKVTGKKDPGLVVIDEVLGQWITILPFAALTWWEYGLAFFLFRFFDILKPCPVRTIENMFEDGPGVMLDDAAAGIYACLCLAVVQFVLWVVAA